MIMKQQQQQQQQLLIPPLLLLLLFLFPLCTTTSGQSSPSGPAPSSDITAVLGKARKFATFIELLKSTQMDAQINDELPGVTVFAPTDSAFSELKPGTLNSFSDQQKAELAQFHVVPTFLTISQFQTVSNPLRTEAAAGEDTAGFPLNVAGNGTHVNITTGLVNTTVDETVYADDSDQLAVYEIPRVLLSQGIPGSQAPAMAPILPNSKKAAPLNAVSPSRSTAAVSVDNSGATRPPAFCGLTVVSAGVLAALLTVFSISL